MKEVNAMEPFPPKLLIGCDGWNWDDWVGVLYPEGTPKSRYLNEYARRFNFVEVDSTFYRIPTKSAVAKWRDQTPDGFLFAAKIPRGVTHTRFRGDYRERLSYYLEVMGELGKKLGPLLFQFRYYRQSEFSSVSAFLDAFEPVLASLPPEYRFAVEVRNKEWVSPELLDALRRHRIAFVLLDHPWAERADLLLERIDAVTADFCYIRWLGHRTKLEKMLDRWDHLVTDRKEATLRWVGVLKDLLESAETVYGIYRNRYAGYAPGSIELLKALWTAHSK